MNQPDPWIYNSISLFILAMAVLYVMWLMSTIWS